MLSDVAGAAPTPLSTLRREFPRVTVFSLILLLAGCNQARDLTYIPNDRGAELPEEHREGISQWLARYYGTPADPHIRRQVAAGEESTVSALAAESVGGGEGPRLIDTVEPQMLKLGAEVYQLRCAGCHGITGDGRGPAAEHLHPLPRDYRQGIFKFISTPRGTKPRRADLARTIRRGAKGTSMPDFRWLPDDELRAVIEYVILLSQRGQLEIQLIEEAEFELDPGETFDPAVVEEFAARIRDSWEDSAAQVVLPVSPMTPATPENIEKGRLVFQGAACVKCHGVDAKGGRRPEIDPDNLPKDDWGEVSFAADLTSGMLRGGRRPIDVYRRIYIGINGSAMPGFANQFQDEPEQIWNLVHFVLSVIDGHGFPIPDEGSTAAVLGASPAAVAADSISPATTSGE